MKLGPSVLSRNLAANAISQASAFGLNLIAFPIYLNILGSESYALVGFGLTVQIWVNVLDVGLSPIFTRDMARMGAGAAEEREVLSFLRSVDWILLAIVLAATALAVITSSFWARGWFDAGKLPASVIDQSMTMIIVFSAIRLASAFYRSGLFGLERQVFTSAVTVVTNVIRLLLPIAIIYAVRDVRLVFAIWLVAALLEVAALRLVLGRSFTARVPVFSFSVAAFRQRVNLGGQIAAMALLWTTVTQADKLILSSALPLAAYGNFSLAVVLAGGLAMVPVPVLAAYQPRLTAAAATDDGAQIAALLHDATRLLAVTTVAPALVLAAIPRIAVFAWTGNPHAAEVVSHYLGPYLAATALLGLGSLLYGLQVAFGRLRLPMIANTVLSIVLIPAMVVVAHLAGARGAALLWLGATMVMATVYYPLVLARFTPGQGRDWYIRDILPPALAAAAIGLAARLAAPDAPDRIAAVVICACTLALGGLAAAGAALASRRFERRVPAEAG